MMDFWRSAIRRQFRAAIDMLANAIEACPESVWSGQGRVYRKDELLGYLEHCRKKLDTVTAGMTEAWTANPCPFSYRDMSNGDLLLYNMRHVQHHAAQLNLLLRQATDSAPRSVSKGG